MFESCCVVFIPPKSIYPAVSSGLARVQLGSCSGPSCVDRFTKKRAVNGLQRILSGGSSPECFGSELDAVCAVLDGSTPTQVLLNSTPPLHLLMSLRCFLSAVDAWW